MDVFGSLPFSFQWRFNGVDSSDPIMLDLISGILNNGQAGTRNYIALCATVNCSATVVRRAAVLP